MLYFANGLRGPVTVPVMVVHKVVHPFSHKHDFSTDYMARMPHTVSSDRSTAPLSMVCPSLCDAF